jgi:hypothetical protein
MTELATRLLPHAATRADLAERVDVRLVPAGRLICRRAR